jgi:benzoyl-CoA reductase/2-hydroxyglutaryl-CoA dehydratase subunit BcrC/BadD/HgdB
MENINMKELQQQMQDIISDPMNALVQKARQDGKTLIGYTCSSVPVPLLSVDGLVPVRVTAPGVTSTEMADTYMSSTMCSYTRSLLEFAMDDRYEFLGGWVHASSCDHLRRLWDNMRWTVKPEFNHILDMPYKVTDHSLEWVIKEFEQLAAALSSHFGADVSKAAVKKSIEEHNQLKVRLKKIADKRKEAQLSFSGTDFHRLMMVSQVAPAYLLDDILTAFENETASVKESNDYRARVMLVGAELDDPMYTQTIESMGAAVVADRYCTGSIPRLDPVVLNGDPIEDLARHALESSLEPRMMERFMDRQEYILKTAKEYNVDGIIIQSIKFCDLWGYEATTLTNALRDLGVPVLRLEREYSFVGEGQLRTRVQAFIESMGK